MGNNQLRVVLDSNVLVSAYVFGGKPEAVFRLIIAERIQGITSQVLISEFLDVLTKKFGVSSSDAQDVKIELEETLELCYPKTTINIVRDVDDNRVIEAAIEGQCDFIVTGDKDLLDLGTYKGIKIVTAGQFLELVA